MKRLYQTSDAVGHQERVAAASSRRRHRMSSGRRRNSTAQSSRRKAAAMVEFALVLPILTVLSMGIAEFGQALKVGQLLSQATREGARVAITGEYTSAQVTQIVQNTLVASTAIDASDITVTITVTNPDGTPAGSNEVSAAATDDLCKVEASIEFTSVNFVPTSFLGSSALKGFCTMRHQ